MLPGKINRTGIGKTEEAVSGKEVNGDAEDAEVAPRSLETLVPLAAEHLVAI
jgi:hypothetical protein